MTKKEQIINTAISLFANEGYETTSIQKLAATAGVAQGLLYRHFKNKEDLLLHLSGIGIAQVQQTLLPYLDEENSFSKAFKEHIRLTCGYLATNRDLWKVIHNARLNHALATAAEADSMVQELVLKPIISKLKQSGYSDADMYAWYIFSLVDGMTSLYLAHPELYPLKQIETFLMNKTETI